MPPPLRPAPPRSAPGSPAVWRGGRAGSSAPLRSAPGPAAMPPPGPRRPAACLSLLLLVVVPLLLRRALAAAGKREWGETGRARWAACLPPKKFTAVYPFLGTA